MRTTTAQPQAPKLPKYLSNFIAIEATVAKLEYHGHSVKLRKNANLVKQRDQVYTACAAAGLEPVCNWPYQGWEFDATTDLVLWPAGDLKPGHVVMEMGAMATVVAVEPVQRTALTPASDPYSVVVTLQGGYRLQIPKGNTVARVMPGGRYGQGQGWRAAATHRLQTQGG